MWLSEGILCVVNTLQGVLSFMVIKQDLKMLEKAFNKSLLESMGSSLPLCAVVIRTFPGSLLSRHFIRALRLCNAFLCLSKGLH